MRKEPILMERGWLWLSTELGRVAVLIGASGATTGSAPGAGLLLGLGLAVSRLRHPPSSRQPDGPDPALIAARLRDAVRQGSRAGQTSAPLMPPPDLPGFAGRQSS